MKKITLNKATELQLLESFRLLSENADKIPNFKAQMETFGYNEERMQQGKAIYDKAVKIYNENQQETALQKQAYTIFSDAYALLKENHQKHRRVAKVALMKNREFWKAFEIDKQAPLSYLKLMQNIRNFYTQLIKHTQAGVYLAVFSLNQEVATKILQDVAKVEELRAK